MYFLIGIHGQRDANRSWHSTHLSPHSDNSAPQYQLVANGRALVLPVNSKFSDTWNLGIMRIVVGNGLLDQRKGEILEQLCVLRFSAHTSMSLFEITFFF